MVVGSHVSANQGPRSRPWLLESASQFLFFKKKVKKKATSPSSTKSSLLYRLLPPLLPPQLRRRRNQVVQARRGSNSPFCRASAAGACCLHRASTWCLGRHRWSERGWQHAHQEKTIAELKKRDRAHQDTTTLKLNITETQQECSKLVNRAACARDCTPRKGCCRLSKGAADLQPTAIASGVL